ncbi:MAG: GTP cyclohydrolase II [Alphaproteobacteria bacterium]|nr:GTP cyclohydrolase II [Alphaproteobacteria bacterium]
MAAPPRPLREPCSAVAAVTRAAIAFREGLPVVIRDPEGTSVAFALETVAPTSLADVKEGVLLLSHARARTLKIRLYTPEVVALPLTVGPSLPQLLAIADPTLDLAEPLKGPFAPLRRALPPGSAAAVRLAKLSGLLPAALVKALHHKPCPEILEVSADDIRAYEEESVETLTLVTRAHVPLEGAERAELVAFRARDGGPEHYAILLNAPSPNRPVLTRLHSECFTGDLLGSLRCDCGPQLRGAIEAMGNAAGGIVLYLAQEGRGIGLINKLRAYRLQDQGFDTLEANERLGFEPDERLYRVAAKMLSLLGYSSVRLLTNNPDKVKALQEAGIQVVERVPQRFAATPHNRNYLEAKLRAGHLP